MQETIIRFSKRREILALVGCCVFAIISLFMLFSPHANQLPKTDYWMSWVALIFFGGGAVVIVVRWPGSKPGIILNDRGINPIQLGTGFIPWSEITKVYKANFSRQTFVCLEVRDPQRWTQKYSAAKREMIAIYEKMGYSPFPIPLGLFRVTADQLIELIECYWHGQKAQQIVATDNPTQGVQ